jgi:hypothetical protein
MMSMPIEITFSIIILLSSYFLTALALIHEYIPGGIKHIREKDGKIRDIINFGRVFGVSFLVASLFSGLMLYVFIFPGYRLF